MNAAGRAKKRTVVLPAIREESRLSTSRIPVHIIPPGATLNPSLFRSSMVIQTLPSDTIKPPPKVMPSLNKMRDEGVEQVVAHYLHFSRYRQSLPITCGFAPLPCPCCSDRNRENLRLKGHPLPNPVSEPSLTKLDRDQNVDSATRSPRANLDDSSFNRGSPRQKQPQQHQNHRLQQSMPYEPSLNRTLMTSWMDYQPLLHARTYLNPEFNRPHLVREYEENRKHHEDASRAYVTNLVLNANAKYHQAMQKLERTAKMGFNDNEDLL
ncbi:uncharacterized protein LOC112573481 [Pomacea canaliculata]|nr:uncharacterized protein LOC112573481 [Pomacea canaliculata]